MRKIFLSIALSLTLTTPAFAGLNVLATLPWIGSAAKEIGKDKINVTVLAKPSQDAHFLEAKPSMILAARKADILMYDGLDLEIGYLPLVIESSKNPKLMPGQPGNFDCSQFITVVEKPTTVDRSMGDVHPLGNPHYHFSPSRVLRVAEGIARLLADADKPMPGFTKQITRLSPSAFVRRKNSGTQYRSRAGNTSPTISTSSILPMNSGFGS